ncbi:hypothetical protein CERSUDRAFT_23957, partial [Gelatoporia subvermispora B]
RSAVRLFFSEHRISDFALFDPTTNTALSHLASRAHQGRALDVQDLLSRFTFDVGSALFGESLDTLSRPLSDP